MSDDANCSVRARTSVTLVTLPDVSEKINKIGHIKKLFLSITAKLVNITILILRLIIAEGIIYKENYSVI